MKTSLVITAVLAASWMVAGCGSDSQPASTDASDECSPGRSATVRPVEDWLVNNPYGALNFADPEGFLTISSEYYPFASINDLKVFAFQDEEPEFDGSIVEETLEDGSVELNLHLSVTDAPLRVISFDDWSAWRFPTDSEQEEFTGPLPQTILGEGDDGSYDYELHLTFRLPEPGLEIPFFFDIEEKSRIRFVGHGSGTFADYAANFGFTPGTRGEVIVDQLAEPADTYLVEIVTVFAKDSEEDDDVRFVDAADLTAQGIPHLQGLQEALDTGGHVILRGSFDIADGTLSIIKNTELEGQTIDGEMAEIVGGKPALLVGANPDLSVIEPDVEATISNIRFRDATDTAIAGVAHKKLVVDGNVITRVFPTDTGNAAVGIFAGYTFEAGRVTGEISVTNNEIDLDPRQELSPHRGYAVFPAVAEDAEITIKDNVVRNFGGHALEVLDCSGSVLIEGNLLLGSSVGAYKPAIGQTGVVVFNGYFVPDGIVESVVRDNAIAQFDRFGSGIVVGYGLSATSELTGRPTPQIVGNSITMDNYVDTHFFTTAKDDVVGIGIELRGLSAAVLTDNRISGRPSIGIGVKTPDLDSDGTGDGTTTLTMTGNNLTGLDTSDCVEAPFVPGTELPDHGTPPVRCGEIVEDLPLR